MHFAVPLFAFVLFASLLSWTLPGCGDSNAPAVVESRQDDDSAAQTPPPLPTIRVVPAFPNLTFTRPVFLTHAGDGSDRLFVLEQPGTIRVFPNERSASDAPVFLDVSERIPRRRHNEEGLLALAFHPKFSENGFFYIYYSAANPQRGVVARFTVSQDDPDRADPASEKIILEAEQPWGNHNGCTLAFGPDGHLYVSLGDGGSAGDPQNNAQDLTTLLGTILRIDVDREEGGRAYAVPEDNPFVDRDGARGEVWAYGLRNVWRMSFDRETGDLWAGDVGQNQYEEIDLITKGGNYGWRLREGKHPFARGEAPAEQLIDPVVEYTHREGLSVTGGYVYRGSTMNRLIGIYLYGDYVTGRIWALRYRDGSMIQHKEVLTALPRPVIASFGEDEAGELYICSFDHVDGRGGSSGRILKIEQN